MKPLHRATANTSSAVGTELLSNMRSIETACQQCAKKRKIRAVWSIAGLLSTLLGLTACTTDVVATWAVTSFDSLLSATGSTSATDVSVNEGWQIASPDDDRFIWSRDFSQPNAPDAALSLDAEAFMAAGLDPDKLPAGSYRYDTGDGRLIVMAELSSAPFDAALAATPLGAFREMVRTSRDAIGYHEELDHYGISLDGVNMLEWAKDATKNDKDLVFVLDPKALTEAGLKPEALNGWTFAAIKTKDGNGRPVEVEKLLKPFDLVP